MSTTGAGGTAGGEAAGSGEGPELDILQLYAHDMNIYGDWGNVLTLKRRAEWAGLNARVHSLEPGRPAPEHVDLVVGGGGQDSGQGRVVDDLQRRSSWLRDLADAGVPMILICGMYQLFGREFRTIDGDRLEGIGVLPVTTVGESRRLIGNIVIDTGAFDKGGFGEVVGFENHSGQTVLDAGARPFGRVLSGEGNNTRDDTEGARSANVIGTYLHGPVLPKNPAVADWMIATAAVARHGDAVPLQPIEDVYADEAHRVAASRPR